MIDALIQFRHPYFLLGITIAGAVVGLLLSIAFVVGEPENPAEAALGKPSPAWLLLGPVIGAITPNVLLLIALSFISVWNE
ncbi:MAG: hypothetical protein WC528_03580 [Patescibacteria group bacterium]